MGSATRALALTAVIAAFICVGTVGSAATHAAAVVCAPPATIQVGTNPTGIAFDPMHSRLYVANSGDDTVTKINACTGAVVETVSLHVGATALCSDMHPQQVTYTRNNGHEHIWVSNYRTGGSGGFPCQA